MRATPSRRRFLAISAAMLSVAPAFAMERSRWRGRALGADVEITLRGPKAQAADALKAARAELARMEGLFSLYDPHTALGQLNARGRLEKPDTDFLEILRLVDRVHHMTGGVFDPTIQPLWRLLADTAGRPPKEALQAARNCIGWEKVSADPRRVRFAKPGMALTLNGIAQGFATDRVSETLVRAGFADTLVNIGEFRAGAGPWQIGIADPALGLVATRPLDGRALASSSPAALPLGEGGPDHIIDPAAPYRRPRWSTVSVEAKTASLADGLSTAFVFQSETKIRMLTASEDDLYRALLVAADGQMLEIT